MSKFIYLFIGTNFSKSSDQIIHHLHDVELALRVAPLARRRMSDAGWSEVCPPVDALQEHMEQSLRDPQGIFLTMDADATREAPQSIVWKKIGRIHVGLPSPRATLPPASDVLND